MSITISQKYQALLRSIVDANDVTFCKLVSLAGLDPRKDFRFANLRDVDFRESDIRGFDFTSADLTGAIKNRQTLVDETTIFSQAKIAWIEGETPDIVDKMLSIQNATSSTQRRKMLVELQEHYRSAEHIHQFLITSIIKAKSIDAFFDFVNAINTIDEPRANLVIRDELRKLVNSKGGGPTKGRRKLAQTPSGIASIARKLDEAINPLLREIAQRVFEQKEDVSRSTVLLAIGDIPSELF